MYYFNYFKNYWRAVPTTIILPSIIPSTLGLINTTS